MKKFLVLCGMLLCISGGAAFAGPSEGGMYYNDGLDYYAKGEYTKAIESFKEAVAKDPTLVDGYYNLGSLFEYLKSYQTAIIYYTKVTQLDPNDMETVLKLAELYNRTGSYEKAMFYAGKIPADSEFAQRASQLKTIIQASAEKTEAKKIASATSTAKEANKTVINRFAGPTGVAMDSKGNLYVASYSDNCIYKVAPNGQTQLYSKSPMINGPIGLAVDSQDNLYVANYNKNNILKINKSGQIVIFMNRITNPYYLLIKGNNMYISEQGNNTVIKYRLY